MNVIALNAIGIVFVLIGVFIFASFYRLLPQGQSIEARRVRNKMGSRMLMLAAALFVAGLLFIGVAKGTI